MSSQDWYTIVTDKFDPLVGTGTTVTDSGGGGSTWQAYLDCWAEDKEIVSLAEGGYVNWGGYHSGISNGDELRSFIAGQHTIAKSSYNSFLTDWNTKVRDDASALQTLKHITDRWADDVWEPVHNEGAAVRQSGVLQTWYGPGAEKYATVVTKQSAAMDEINAMSKASGTGLESVTSVIKTLTLAILHGVQPIKDKLAGWPKHGFMDEHDSDMVFGERTAYAAAQFQGLQQWLANVLNEGDWKNTTDQVRIQFEDLKQKSQSFQANVWPKAVVNGIDDMKNGNAGLGDKAGSPTQGPTGSTGDTPTQPGSDPDPDSGGTKVKDDGSYEGGSPNTTGDGTYTGDSYHGKDADGDNSDSTSAGSKYNDY